MPRWSIEQINFLVNATINVSFRNVMNEESKTIGSPIGNSLQRI